MLRTTRCIKLTTFFALAVLLAAPLYAAPATGGVADVVLGTTQVNWVPLDNNNAALSLAVSGPEGIVERNFEAGEVPTFDLTSLTGNIDGSYSWQLTATPKLSGESRRLMDQARMDGTTFVPNDLPPREQLVQSGHFRVLDGAIVQPSVNPEPELALDTGGDTIGMVSDAARFMAEAAQTFVTDVIVQGSLCVGVDCTSSESFGFDTIRLKENNLRIKFQDTSTGSFPTADWQITINDSSNGGASYYRIEDVTNNKVPFTIEANTPNNTLYVDSTGRVGIGTNLPVVEAHVQDGDTPTLRLHQDGSSGFAQQIWDIAGNETNFFVRDVTNASKLSFRIKPGAPDNSVFIAANGDIGMGTDSPDQPLHVVTNDDADFVLMLLEHNGASRIRLANTADNVTWNFGHQNPGGVNLVWSDTGDATTEMQLDPSGNLTIAGTLIVQGGGGATVPDYVFAPDYELMPLAELQKFIAEKGHLPRIPSQAEFDERGAINMTEMQLLLWEKVEELTLYTLDQQQTIEGLRSQLAKLESAKAD